MTKKQKLETFDQVAAKADKLSLALYDLVNHAFGTAERIMFKDFDSRERTGSILVRMSWRAMPLFLVKNDNGSVDVYTESDIEDMYRKSPAVPYYQMLKSAMDKLERKELASTGVCRHCGATGRVGTECGHCEPQDGLGRMVYQSTDLAEVKAEGRVRE